MAIIGWYYLHKNGELIYRHDYDDVVADIRESDLAVGLWPFDGTNRASAWRILVEAGAAGVSRQRINTIATKWGCDDKDGHNYARYVGIDIFMDGDAWCATRKDFIDLHESPAGFGDTILEACIELCINLGYKPSKMWGSSFEDLVKVKE